MNPMATAPDAAPLLGVNIDHVATLRNARGGGFPDPVMAAQQAVEAGADIITFHLREDRRHIRDADVERLKAVISAPLNFESALAPEMLDIICRVRPQMVCLVPERRQEVTTEGGLDVVGQFERVREACARLADCGCVVSLFIEPSAQQIEASARAGAPCIELHTGAYANAFDASDAGAQQREFDRIAAGLKLGRSLGLDTHAGHGLSLQSTPAIAALPEVSELHIGHALIGHAVFVGLKQSVRDFQAAIIRAAADARTN